MSKGVKVKHCKGDRKKDSEGLGERGDEEKEGSAGSPGQSDLQPFPSKAVLQGCESRATCKVLKEGQGRKMHSSSFTKDWRR